MGLLRGVLYIKPLTNEKSHSATTHRMVPFRSPILWIVICTFMGWCPWP